jgi:hypothetical protein
MNVLDGRMEWDGVDGWMDARVDSGLRTAAEGTQSGCELARCFNFSTTTVQHRRIGPKLLTTTTVPCLANWQNSCGREMPMMSINWVCDVLVVWESTRV